MDRLALHGEQKGVRMGLGGIEEEGSKRELGFSCKRSLFLIKMEKKSKECESKLLWKSGLRKREIALYSEYKSMYKLWDK